MERVTGGTAGRLAIGIAVVVALVVAIVIFPLQPWAESLVGWIHGAGGLGVAVFVLAYSVRR